MTDTTLANDNLLENLHWTRYKRILVVGRPASGKTTLAKYLANITKLPYFGLDQLNWDESWQRVSKAELERRIGSTLALERWIIEGNYQDSLELRLQHADLCIEIRASGFPVMKAFLLRSLQRNISLRPPRLPYIRLTLPQLVQGLVFFVKKIVLFECLYGKQQHIILSRSPVPVLTLSSHQCKTLIQRSLR